MMKTRRAKTWQTMVCRCDATQVQGLTHGSAEPACFLCIAISVDGVQLVPATRGSAQAKCPSKCLFQMRHAECLFKMPEPWSACAHQAQQSLHYAMVQTARTTRRLLTMSVRRAGGVLHR
jgi:hypothetical protein